MSELRTIPNIGACTRAGPDTDGVYHYRLIAWQERRRTFMPRSAGCAVALLTAASCIFIVPVEYFVNTGNPDPDEVQVVTWKDDFVEPSPCGAVCVKCASFPLECGGCRKIKGKILLVAVYG